MKEKINKNCGIRLRECREAVGMTQKQLADAIHTTYQSISNIERGERRLTADNARAAAKVLGVRMEYLLCEDGIKTEKQQFYKHIDTTNNFRALLGIAEVMLVYDYGERKNEDEAEYIIGAETETNKAEYIICSYNEIDEISKMMGYLFKGWFNKIFLTQNRNNPELSRKLEEYAYKNFDEDWSYEAVISSFSEHSAKINGII